MNRATIVINTKYRYRSYYDMDEKYYYVALKQIRVKTSADHNGTVMISCGIKLHTKTYFENSWGVKDSDTVIKTFLTCGSSIVKDFSKDMEFHKINGNGEIDWIEMEIQDAYGYRIQAEGEYVVEMLKTLR